jgi:hypothetical protein
VHRGEWTWKIIAILRPRNDRTVSCRALTSSCPSSQISPDIRTEPGLCSPMIERLVTLLPEPDSPTMPSVLPRSRLNDSEQQQREGQEDIHGAADEGVYLSAETS